ncbi:coiled-coil domain-containing protein 170 isoform X2 [Planococcus citri]|uniref:coiled-coil domain-containing protein 170 isoform X2 n=1 Tax=Planococcus citri TaxID=170843 RepID=UPI0031F8EE99
MISTHTDTENDWRIFKILCTDTSSSTKMSNEDLRIHDVTTSLRSELAALQYKRDRLLNELSDVQTQLKSREQRVLELQTETEQLKEQAARQNSIITSLRNRVQELEERERTLNNALTRTEMSVETLTRENRYQNEKIKEMEMKINHLDMERSSEEQNKKYTQRNMIDVVKRLATALGAEPTEFTAVETVSHKASDLIQDVSMLRTKTFSLTDNLTTVEMELRNCREQLEKTISERESLKRQTTTYIIEIDRLKQDKEALETKQRVLERELSELKDKLQIMTRTLNNATTDISSQETAIDSLKNDVKKKEEKIQEVQNELTHLLETLAIITSTPTHFVEPQIHTIKDRVKQIVHDIKEKTIELEDLRTKYTCLSQQSTYDSELRIQEKARLKSLEEEKSLLETRLHKTESELTSCEIIKENLKRDKVIFVTFLDRLSRILNMDEISKEVGIELHTESILLRTEQLAKLESGKTIDKSAVVYQLQKRIRTLREQLQRRDLHLDLLRKKINLQEENTRVRSLLEAEKEEANLRVKKLQKQNDKLQLQLTEARAVARDLRNQLNEADEFKTRSIERGQKIEELQKRLTESETLRIRYLEKLTTLKEQLRITSETGDQDRTMNEHTIKLLKEDLINVKQSLSECQRAEHMLSDLRRSVVSLLGLDSTCPDYEIVSKLSKLINAHREYTLVTKRYDDPLPMAGAISPRYGTLDHSVGNRYLTYDSKYYDALLDDVDASINAASNKRPTKNF